MISPCMQVTLQILQKLLSPKGVKSVPGIFLKMILFQVYTVELIIDSKLLFRLFTIAAVPLRTKTSTVVEDNYSKEDDDGVNNFIFILNVNTCNFLDDWILPLPPPRQIAKKRHSHSPSPSFVPPFHGYDVVVDNLQKLPAEELLTLMQQVVASADDLSNVKYAVCTYGEYCTLSSKKRSESFL